MAKKHTQRKEEEKEKKPHNNKKICNPNAFANLILKKKIIVFCFNFVLESVGLELDRPSSIPSPSLVIMCDRVVGLSHSSVMGSPHSSIVGRSFLKEMSWRDIKPGL